MKYRTRLWQALAELSRRTNFYKIGSNTTNAILNYHSISANENGLFGNLSPDRFRRDLEFLNDNFEIVDLPYVLSNPTSNKKRIAITFDDGYANFYDNTAPLLEEFDAPATVFVNPSFVGDANRERILSVHTLSDPPSRIIMDRSELLDLVESDLVTIGSHTLTHPNLSKISDTDVLEDEIIGSKQRLEEELGITVNRFAYPYGGCNQAALEIVRQSHDYGAGTSHGLVTNNCEPHRLPRIGAHQSERMVRWELTDLSQQIRTAYERFLF